MSTGVLGASLSRGGFPEQPGSSDDRRCVPASRSDPPERAHPSGAGREVLALAPDAPAPPCHRIVSAAPLPPPPGE